MKQTNKTDSLQLSNKEIGLLCYAMAMGPRQLSLAAKKISQEYSLGPRGVWILGLIAAGPLFPLDLTKIFKVGRSLITAELTRLTEAGLITMSKHEEDGRRFELALTPLGEKIHTVLGDEISTVVHTRLASYTREEILLCTRLLRDFCGSSPEDD